VRVLIKIALLVGAAFMILSVLAHLAQELSRLSYHSPPDPDNSDDWDVALDDSDDTAPLLIAHTEQRPISRYRNARTQGCISPGVRTP